MIDFSVLPNKKFSAGTYYYDFLPNGENDFIRYRDGANGESEVLNRMDIPVLIIFGDSDECVLTQPIDVVQRYLSHNIKNCTIEIMEGANHSYTHKELELGEIIKKEF